MAKIALVILILLFIPVLAFGIYVLYTRYRAKRANLPPPPIPFLGQRSNPFSDRNATGGGGGNGGATRGAIGIFNTIRSKIPFLNKSNRRTGAGAYEQALAPSAGRRGLDPDEAWDTRVGTEADGYGQGGGGYYEEQELGGIRPALNHSTYSGGGYGDRLTNNNNNNNNNNAVVIPEYGGSSSSPPTSSPEEPRRGRSRSREATDYIGGGRQQQRQRGSSGLDDSSRYDEEEMGFRQEPGPGSKKRDNNNDPFADDTAERSDLRGGGMGVGLRPVVVETEPRRGASPFGLRTAHEKTESSGLVGDSSPTERRSLFRENI